MDDLSSEGNDPPRAEQPHRMPLWVRGLLVAAIVVAVIIALIVVLGDGTHGPGRHTPGSAAVEPGPTHRDAPIDARHR